MTENPCSQVDTVFALARGGVLIIAAIAGIVCIYLGWRLYNDAVVSKSKGEFQGGGLRFTLTAASPGVFLVAFGIWLLITLVNRTATLEHTEENVRKEKPTAMQSGVLKMAAAKKLPVTEEQPCILRRKTTRVLFSGGEVLNATHIEDAMRQSISGLTRAGDYGVTDITERAALIGTLQIIREAANENRKP